MDQKHLTKRKRMSTVKRFSITIACCFPAIITLGLILNGKVSNLGMILIFTAVLLTAVTIVELFNMAKIQKAADEKPRKDVFK